MRDVMRYALSCPTFAREICQKDPDPWQERVMTSPSKRMIFCCTRQAGKSTTAALIALHRALFYPGSTILVVSPTQRQSDLLFKKITEFYKLVPDQPKLQEDNKRSMTLRNGSWIVSIPGSEDTIRGYSNVDLLIEDESAKVADEVYYTVLPMLAVSNGKLILMSTPFGRIGHFFEEWHNGGDQWERVKITAHECPRITAEFLEEQRRTMGDWWFTQEFLCEFGDTMFSLFKYDDIMAAFTDDEPPLYAESATLQSAGGDDVDDDDGPLLVG